MKAIFGPMLMAAASLDNHIAADRHIALIGVDDALDYLIRHIFVENLDVNVARLNGDFH